MPDPTELATSAGWRRAQQIRYHAQLAKQWDVAAQVTTMMAQHLALDDDHERAEELLFGIYRGGDRYSALARAGAAVQLALLHDRKGQSESALHLLTEALPALERDRNLLAYALMRIGILFARIEGHESALDWFTRAETASDGDQFLRAQVRDEMAMSETARGNFERAAELHGAALAVFEAERAYPAIFVNMAAQARLDARRSNFADGYGKAVAAAEVAISCHMFRQAADLLLDAGDWAEQIRDFAAAERALRRSLEIGTPFEEYPAARAHYYLGRVYTQVGAIDPAIYHVAELARLQPEQVFTEWLEGLILKRQELGKSRDGSSQ